MRGFTFRGPGDAAELTDLPDPSRVPARSCSRSSRTPSAAPTCGSCAGRRRKGVRPGVVLGHEVSGTIAELGDGVEGYEVGTLCGVSPIFACGVCRVLPDRAARTSASTARVVGYDVDGGLGEWMVIPEVGVRAGRLVPAPDGVPPEQLALAEPLACCLNGIDQYRVEVGEVVVDRSGPARSGCSTCSSP